MMEVVSTSEMSVYPETTWGLSQKTYLVFTAFTSGPALLLASSRASVYFFVVFVFLLTKLTASAQAGG
jgi:hypothetical protein